MPLVKTMKLLSFVFSWYTQQVYVFASIYFGVVHMCHDACVEVPEIELRS